MIKANELRIGNWLQFEPEQGGIEFIQVTEIHEGSFYAHGDEVFPNEKYDGHISPISLSPEILEKCGFVKSTFSYFELSVYFIEPVDDYWVFGERYQGAYAKIKSLHQLQNLYFCLCGEELNIQL